AKDHTASSIAVWKRGCRKLESEILNQLQGACSATLLKYRPKEFSLRRSGRVESRHGYSSSRCDSRGFQHDCVESGRGMGGGARVAEVSGAGRESGSCEGKVAGEVVEDGERGMGGG